MLRYFVLMGVILCLVSTLSLCGDNTAEMSFYQRHGYKKKIEEKAPVVVKKKKKGEGKWSSWEM